MNRLEPYQYLPLWAKCAIERLDCDSSLRTATMLDSLLDAYATTYAMECEENIRASAHHICARRFTGSFQN